MLKSELGWRKHRRTSPSVVVVAAAVQTNTEMKKKKWPSRPHSFLRQLSLRASLSKLKKIILEFVNKHFFEKKQTAIFNR
jgi:hypothetical protein